MDAKQRQLILEIIESGRDLSLATLREDGYPQANVIGYANDGLTLFFGTARTSQKIKNIQRCEKVSMTITMAYNVWNQIRGLSMAATAHILADDSPESAHAMDRLLARFPTAWDMSPPAEPGQVVFVKLVPVVVNVIDYTRGFGHSELVEIGAGDLPGKTTESGACGN
ncbi:pyridoxamine 5'-phosphate oxidase family protein [Caballeronia sp. DA-9]|uniref:pyridoxamine 5'-phosphate oxidase family protein n=1 Tax=Caballeronia sp. DA-9 TaxID=3436237 RepID=UPI003F66C4B3